MHCGIDGWGRPYDDGAAVERLDADVVVLQEAWTSAGEAEGQAERIGAPTRRHRGHPRAGRGSPDPPPARGHRHGGSPDGVVGRTDAPCTSTGCGRSPTTCRRSNDGVRPSAGPGASRCSSGPGSPSRTARPAFTQLRRDPVRRAVVRLAGPQPPSRVAHLRVLDLHHFGAEPGERLGAGRTGLELGEIDDANAGEHVECGGVVWHGRGSFRSRMRACHKARVPPNQFTRRCASDPRRAAHAAPEPARPVGQTLARLLSRSSWDS